MEKYTGQHESKIGQEFSVGGNTYTVVDIQGDLNRKLVGDILPALEVVVSHEPDLTISRRADGAPGFHATTVYDDGYGQTVEEALRYMLASSLTSWDDFGMDDY